jgi:hypothetical protein
MSRILNQNKTLLINCTGADINNEECLANDKRIQKQFAYMIIIVFVILLCFLGFFIYNLIKCYLPKWRKTKLAEESRSVEIQNANNIPQ